MGATALPGWVERDPARAVEYARALADGAEQAAAEARAILVRMRADQPDRPLAEILGALCQEFAGEAGVPCSFEAHDVADVPHEARYELVSIAGEALENVRRHADASAVQVSLRGRSDVVELVVNDNGSGFDATADGPKGHFGMQGMSERARQVGGELVVTSCPSEGTTIRVRIPVVQQVDEKGIA
jgi:signal transduction histidine kinase